MLNLHINESRSFVKKLLMDSTFDSFLVMECYVRSGITYSFDGRINKSFYDSDELEKLPSADFAAWENVRPHVYNVIRGKKLPLGFKIVLILSETAILDLLERNNITISSSDIANLTLNIYYGGEGIQLTTMATQRVFTMDKTLEQTWDNDVRAFLKKNEIYFTEE